MRTRGHGCKRQFGKHLGRIAAQFGALCQQQYPNVFACLVQLAGDYKSVSAVISLAANNPDTFGRRIV